MTLLDAPQYNAKKERARRIVAIVVVVVVIVAASAILYYPRFEAGQIVNHFMTALVKKNFQEAYYLWKPDPKQYPMDAFMQDWGPGSKWGIIKTYKIEQLGIPPGGHASGLVAIVQINGIQSRVARIWVQNGTHEMSFYQF